MVKIVIENWGQKELAGGTTGKSLLAHFQAHHLDWMHACGGKGRCTTCKVRVLEGMENLGTLTAAEQKYRHLGALQAHERLSCQAIPDGPVVVAVPEEYKLPHVRYE
jgi:2Fe-2S ferredoxin